ncbi:MAG TPA: hypothetical protein VMF89_07130, partial [Polyangiales bacterium]|nr:hypothetical protein [Polyangiales bacterium]
MQRITRSTAVLAASLLTLCWAGACEDDTGAAAGAVTEKDAGSGDAGHQEHEADAGTDASASPSPTDEPAADGGTTAQPTRVAIVTSVANADNTSNGYLLIVPPSALNGDELSLDDAREFAGNSDVWIMGKHAYVASGDAPAVTKYEVQENNELREVGSVSFENFGVSDAAFWNNTFVSETKAYLSGTDASELIVWNPTSLEIEGTIEIEGLEPRGDLFARAALADRSNLVSNGKLYRPIYWTDEDYAGRTEDSVIVVIDTKTDEVVNKIKVDATGMDYGTVDDDGLLYFSTWTGSVGTRLALDTPPTAFAVVDPKTDTVKSITEFARVTGGHEGAAMKYVGDGQFVFSVYDET